MTKPTLLSKTIWHTTTTDEALRATNSDSKLGLTESAVALRQQQYGLNVLTETKRRSPLKMIINQFKDFMVLVLIGSAIISGFLGESEDTIAILVIVVMNAILGFVQEYRAERAMEALKALTLTKSKVLRDGAMKILNAEQLVPGDIVSIEAGDLIPADLRILENQQLRSDESALTGESLPVEKITDPLVSDDLSVGDRRNILHKGTLITYGRGIGLVIATGMQTEIGRIATLLHGAGDSQTPLQKRLALFGKRIALFVIGLCLFILVIGVIRGEDPVLMFMTALSLAVAAIPEALPAVVTVLLALGARRMVNKNALVKRLPAVETLGSVTYICSDKTGTLTQNRMQVKQVFCDHHTPPEGPLADLFYRAMSLNNDAYRDEKGDVIGDPTEKALFEYAEIQKYAKKLIEVEWPRVAELPFSSERSMMSTLHQDQSKTVYCFTKGAPERVLARCRQQLTHQGERPIEIQPLSDIAEAMAREGLRVLALGYRILPEAPPTESLTSEQLETELTFLGFAGLIDPPREEVKQAILDCQNASIKVVMITGDHPVTATAIARQLGIIKNEPTDPPEIPVVLTGGELAKWPAEEFKKKVEHIRVYARVSPEQKIDIVRSLQENGEFVAMTGDGVNDAPALKKADIGVSMGKIGTDVAREASAMVLLDDNFTTIVHAVREGRHIFDNIRKFVKYALATNAGEVWTLFLAPFIGLPVPFLPIHILWINLVTDGLPGLALATEPEEKGIMKRPPRPPQESIFAHGLWQHVLWVGLTMAVVNLAVVAWYIEAPQSHWQTMVFTIMTLMQMGHILAIRSERDSLFTQGLMSNRYLFGAVVTTVILQLATIYVPALNKIFKTQPLTLSELLVCFAVAPALFVAVEFEKFLSRKGLLYDWKKLQTY
jgi:Ca2+-transporting ATPase